MNTSRWRTQPRLIKWAEIIHLTLLLTMSVIVLELAFVKLS